MTPAATTAHTFSGSGNVEETYDNDSYFRITTTTPTDSVAFWTDDDSDAHTRMDYTEVDTGYQYSETGSSQYHTDSTIGIELQSDVDDVHGRFESVSHSIGTNVAAARPLGDTWTTTGEETKVSERKQRCQEP